MKRSIFLSCIITFVLTLAVTAAAYAQGLKIGQKVDGVLMVDLKGNPHNLKKQIGAKPTVIWITDGGEVDASGVDNFKELHSSYSKKGVTFFIICTSDERTARKFVSEGNIDIPVFLGGTDPLTKQLSGESGRGISPICNLFVIDKTGALRYKGHLPGVSTRKIENEIINIM